MYDIEFERLRKLKKERTELFSAYENTMLYKELSTNSSKVKDIQGVKELMTSVDKFDGHLSFLFSSHEKGVPITNGDFEAIEKKLDKIRECRDKIDWGIRC